MSLLLAYNLMLLSALATSVEILERVEPGSIRTAQIESVESDKVNRHSPEGSFKSHSFADLRA
jgi:hypothetical protein